MCLAYFSQPVVSGFPKCAEFRHFATSHPQHRLHPHPASHLRPRLFHVVSFQEVIVLFHLSSPYCGTSRKLSKHTLCISSFQSLVFSHFYISHTFLRHLPGILSMERDRIQSIFRNFQNLALFAGLRPGIQEYCRTLLAFFLHFLVVQAPCGFLLLILSKAFFRLTSPQLPSHGSVRLEAVLNRLGYTGLHRLFQFAPV